MFSKLRNRINENIGFIIILAIILLGAMAVPLLRDTKHAAENAGNAAENTARLITKQDETLDAIRKLTTDTKLTAEEKTNTIICMLKVPVTLRTENTEDQCRKEAQNTLPSRPNPPESLNNTNTQPRTETPAEAPKKAEKDKKPKDNGGNNGNPGVTSPENIIKNLFEGLLNPIGAIVSFVKSIYA